LVLSSGAAGGLAHVGVIKALQEAGVVIDAIVGSSIGALVGGCFASRGNIGELERLIERTDWKRLLALADINLAFILKGFVQGEKVKALLKPIIGDVQFSDLKIPLVVTATDVFTGKGILIKEGSVIDAVRASISMPVIFTPVKYGERYLTDGGVVNPIPVEAARKVKHPLVVVSDVTRNPAQKTKIRQSQMGQEAFQPVSRQDSPPEQSDIITSFNAHADMLIQESDRQRSEIAKLLDNFRDLLKSLREKTDPDMPHVVTTLLQSIYAMEHKIASIQAQGADIVITPDIAHIDTLEFYRGCEAISRGYEAAKEALSKRKILKSLAR